MRAFANKSNLIDGKLNLVIAPALTPKGIEDNPNFFSGYATYPQVVSRGLLVLADIASTRYFKYVPVTLRDPVLTAQGDRLRAECFSACNGVYARFDIFQSGLDGEIGYGTTNVDLRMDIRTSLTQVKQKDKLYININGDGLTTARLSELNNKMTQLHEVVHEEKVNMPDRWIRALGNTAEIHKSMKPVFSINKIQSQMFISKLPSSSTTSKSQDGWLTLTTTGVKLMQRKTSKSVFISGLHRLSALKRIMTNVSKITFYEPTKDNEGHFMMDIELEGGRLTISLTPKSWQGYSGEGALLESLAHQEILEDAENISSMLEFESVINELEIVNKWGLDQERVKSALAFLAVSGKLGYDVQDDAYFHRELPMDEGRILKDNPRLVSAKKLTDSINKINDNQWIVNSNETDYRVTLNTDDETKDKCTCTWYLKYKNQKGPCKHILAVKLKEGKDEF